MESYLCSCIENYKTPFYLFNLDVFRERVEKIHQYLGKRIEICYSMRANPFLAGTAKDFVDRLEVCSPGEFSICEKNNVPVEKIVLAGIYKEEQEIRRVLETYNGRGVFTMESAGQVEMFCRLAKTYGFGKEKDCLKVLLRLSSGDQFGMDPDMVREIIKCRSRLAGLDIIGIQYYTGTQKKKEKIILDEFGLLDDFLEELSVKYDYQAEILEYGPGFFVPYFIKEEDVELASNMAALRMVLKGLRFKGKITLEIGRFLSAFCGKYVTQIVDVKKNHDITYAVVDGGTHHLQYHGQNMGVKIPHICHLDESGIHEKKDRYGEGITVCGCLCTEEDVLIRNLPMADVKKGDVLVFERTGAYSVTDAPYLFLSRDLPKILFYSDDAGIRLVRDSVHSSWLNGGEIV